VGNKLNEKGGTKITVFEERFYFFYRHKRSSKQLSAQAEKKGAARTLTSQETLLLRWAVSKQTAVTQVHAQQLTTGNDRLFL